MNKLNSNTLYYFDGYQSKTHYYNAIIILPDEITQKITSYNFDVINKRIFITHLDDDPRIKPNVRKWLFDAERLEIGTKKTLIDQIMSFKMEI